MQNDAYPAVKPTGVENPPVRSRRVHPPLPISINQPKSTFCHSPDGKGLVDLVVVVVNARPRRPSPYVLHTARSSAQLRASPADRPQSEQIWCSQVMGGRPRDLCQFGKGGTPSRTSHATRRTALAGTLWGIRVVDLGTAVKVRQSKLLFGNIHKLPTAIMRFYPGITSRKRQSGILVNQTSTPRLNC